MAERLLKLKTALQGLAQSNDAVMEVMLEDEQWDQLELLVKGTKGMFDAITTLEGSKYITSSLVLPALYQLWRDIQRPHQGKAESKTIRDLKLGFREHLEIRYVLEF
jgi:hypothetical protein